MYRKRNPFFWIGSIVTFALLSFVFMGYFYTPYDPQEMEVSRKFAKMSFQHLMGCDQFGRDIFSRVLEGSGNTLWIATATTMIGAFFGLIFGGLSGYIGGRFDKVVMGFNDAVFSFPSMLLALVMVSVLGTGTVQVILALGISFIPSFVRVVRSEFLKQKSMDYVSNARLMGASTFRIVWVHILPNSRGVLCSSIMIGFNNAVLAEAGLSFLGLGVPPPNASLGGMLSEAQGYLFSMPSYSLCVGGVLIAFLLGASFLAENSVKG